MSAITTESLTRTFGDVVAVDAVSVRIPTGGVVGLVGPNGSGKSTMIRMLLGLIRPTSGTATMLGQPVEGDGAYLARVGALVENPAFVPGLSARANLASLAQVRGLPASRVDAVLDIVGLVGRDREPVKRFSLGMKQRLGIAAALLPDPELLVLDEPTNGLDPSGIVEIRALLGALAQEGRTVVVSSHLLSEIEAVCDHLVVIRFGELLYSGPVADLLARSHGHVDVVPERAVDLPALVETLRGAGHEVEPTSAGVRVVGAAGRAADINREAAAVGITLTELRTVRESLEQVFLDLTGTDDGEVAAARARQAEGGR
ncbi:ABC-2 type transport system ATP-binding protein [Isoptericola jiangsuensis]|uniref:ABC-2 type transport system ATP-binding protein n=1 Tax=Isoptericola jiangsuensis TaxID=548579 RepID=A0A2A9EXY5_9MICO|nr:ATP-binding cassette domain-containing protein [Isoptericola jiangsuensis]PFG43371.1 ABC-2 type transport system ATP-binding protein [Isoptericola jiangsuensis]